MSVENHLGLPEEVFEIILQYLDLRDVLSCSSVCIGWRNAVNSNHVWEMLCKRNIPEQRLKARTECKRMASSYEVSDSENMPKLCFWRARFMDDISLKRNWRNGWFQEDLIGDITISLHDFETDYELLLEPSMSRSSFTVYNIVDSPIMTDIMYFALQHPIPEFFKLSNNILVVVQCTLLQVYLKDADKNLNFIFAALFDRDHNHSKTIPDTRNLSNWYTQNVGFYPCDIYVNCDHNGKYFVGMFNLDNVSLNASVMHIWDLETQTKVREVAFPRPMPGESIIDVSFSLRNNVIHIILKLLVVDHGTPTNSIYSYDIDKSTYSDTVLRIKYVIPIILFTETMAILTDLLGKRLFLFDLKDARLLDTLDNTNSIEYRTLQVFGNLLTYVEFNRRNTQFTKVTVYDVEKLHYKDKFQVPSCKAIHSIHIFMEDLMIIGTPMHLLIRDLKNGETLRTVEYLDFFPPDPSCTKMIVQKPEGELVLLHFW